jgi:putative ABC transport system permease protein
MLVKSPGTSLLAVLALGLGIGLTSVMFNCVNGVLLSKLPFADPDRLVNVSSFDTEGARERRITPHDFLDWQEQASSFSGLAAYGYSSVTLCESDGFPQRYSGGLVTYNTLSLLGVQPLLGRSFNPQDDEHTAERVVILGHAVWRNGFAGDRQIIGQTLEVDGEPATVIGVMPPAFAFPSVEEVWLPLRIDTSELERGEGPSLLVIGRLAEGVTVESAEAELSLISERMAALYPETNPDSQTVVKSYRSYLNSKSDVRILTVMQIVVSLVLLISCANVASLLLARATRRSKELAIRTALGARRLRVVTLLLSEGALLSVIGAGLGLLLAHAGTTWIDNVFRWRQFPYWIEFTMDHRGLLFVIFACLASGLIAGLPPALRASRTSCNDVLKDESLVASGLRLGRLNRLLVMAEIALACTLLVVTTLMIRSVVNLHTIDVGFNTDSVLLANLELQEVRYPEESDCIRFFQSLKDEVRSLPEVCSVSVMSDIPAVAGRMGSLVYRVEGKQYDNEGDVAAAAVVTPEFFDLFEIARLEGRLFDQHDTLDSQYVAIVNQSFANREWPGQSPIGKRFELGRGDDRSTWTVVGMVADGAVDSKVRPSVEPPPAGFYLPHSQYGLRKMVIAVKTEGAPEAITTSLRAKVAGLDQNLALYGEQTMERAAWEVRFTSKIIVVLFSAFGIAALILASVGIFGVMLFSVNQRTHEIGLRMALGASGYDVTRLILRQGLLRLLIGLTIGLGLALALGQTVRVFLFGLEPTDPVSIVATLLVLVTVALAACLIPARRAAKVEPSIALRYL